MRLLKRTSVTETLCHFVTELAFSILKLKPHKLSEITKEGSVESCPNEKLVFISGCYSRPNEHTPIIFIDLAYNWLVRMNVLNPYYLGYVEHVVIYQWACLTWPAGWLSGWAFFHWATVDKSPYCTQHHGLLPKKKASLSPRMH